MLIIQADQNFSLNYAYKEMILILYEKMALTIKVDEFFQLIILFLVKQAKKSYIECSKKMTSLFAMVFMLCQASLYVGDKRPRHMSSRQGALLSIIFIQTYRFISEVKRKILYDVGTVSLVNFLL